MGRLHYDALGTYAADYNSDLSFVKSAFYGGEQADLIWESKITSILQNHHMSCSVINGYGMTETEATILFTPSKKTCGLIPFYDVNVKIVDPDNSDIELGYDVEGELFLSSKTMMIGYYNNEQETVDTIVIKDGVRWLRTHDLAKISKDGFITITGRIKRIYSRTTSDMIQIRVYPMRIEEELSKSELVERCAVVGIKDDVVAYRSIAFIILNDKTINPDKAKTALDRLCRENLPESHVPDEYRFVESFPLTRAGKVDYRALEKMTEEEK